MWQALRTEVRPVGVEIVTVCLETLGAEEGRPYVDAAQPEHPTLLDEAHVVDALFGIVNIPNAVWIDEEGRIVRPAEPAWPGPRDTAARRAAASELPAGDRMSAVMAQATQIVAWTADEYADAIRDWARNGAASRFVLTDAEVIARSGPRGRDESAAAAHFEIAQHLEREGDHAGAVPHFREAHRLDHENWTYKRQAWSIEGGVDGPMRRFWQGPVDGQEWPYESDWLRDITESGAANYYRETHFERS